MNADPTGLTLAVDPTRQRMSGVTAHGNKPFDVPFISEVDGNLWQGGCEKGLLLPKFIKHLVSLYPWEAYKVKHELGSSLVVRMFDDADQELGQVNSIAEWVDNCRKSGPVLVHCFPPGTLVGAPTPVPIEDATEVFGHDGRLHKVTAHHSRPFDGDLIILRTTGAIPVRCTPEHPVLVVRPYYFPGGFKAKPGMKSLEQVGTVVAHYADQPVWLRADEVREGDFLVSPRLNSSAEAVPVPWPVAGVNSKPVGPLIPDEDTAWMLGLYAADGGTSGLNSVNFVLSLKDDLDRLVAVWRSMGIEPKVRHYENYVRVVINSRAVRNALAEWCGKGAAKRLPEFVLRDNWPLAPVIEGYAAGDGYVNKKGAIACRCISPILIEQIRSALVTCGESPTVSPIKRSSGYPNAKPIYEVQWNPGATQHHTAWWRGHYLLPVTSIERELYAGTVYNLAVADAETFTVNGVITHNCQAGLNRSSLVVAQVLKLNGFTGPGAIEHIRLLRSPACLCNKSFEKWVRDSPVPRLENS